MVRRKWIGVGALATVSLFASEASATYSVVAADSRSQHVGGAGTSCVGSLDVAIILGVAPAKGAVHAQAQINTMGRDEAVALLMQDATAQNIVDDITAASFDPAAAQRQYGVVSLLGGAAGFTGANNGDFASDRQGTVETVAYSVQGNILTSVAVLDAAEAAFVGGDACDMPERMMLALEAGAANGEGDSRCTPNGIPSDSAFIRVVDENGQTIVDLTVTDTAPMSPLISLRAAFENWRVDNPCPDPSAGSTGAASSSGGEDTTSGTTTGATTAGSTSSATSSTTGPDPMETTAPGTTEVGTSGPPAGSVTGGETPAATGDQGCGCDAAQPPASAVEWFGLLWIVAVGFRRRP